MEQSQVCKHIESITTLKVADEFVCSECVKAHTDWVHLRTCQTCGVTLCCDQSPMRHMTAHNHQTKHPVVSSAQPGERWLWCYPDELFVDY